MIATTNGRLAVMVLDDVWEPAIPIVDTSTLGQDDRQHFIWGFPEIDWAASGGDLGNAILDMNTRLSVYLNTFYGYAPPLDLTSLIVKYLAEELMGDYVNRWNQLVDDATL